MVLVNWAGRKRNSPWSGQNQAELLRKKWNQGELSGLCFFWGVLWIVRLECIDRVHFAGCVHPWTFESVLVEVGPAVVEFTYDTVAFWIACLMFNSEVLDNFTRNNIQDEARWLTFFKKRKAKKFKFSTLALELDLDLWFPLNGQGAPKWCSFNGLATAGTITQSSFYAYTQECPVWFVAEMCGSTYLNV